MLVMKFYKTPGQPEFVRLDRIAYTQIQNIPPGWLLITRNLDKPERKRIYQWIDPTKVYIDWIREFKE
jgi:hypothetical protein